LLAEWQPLSRRSFSRREAGGRRCALEHTQIVIHQPLGGVSGQATDIELHARNIIRLKECLNGILAAKTGQSAETIAAATERDNFMTAEEALGFGLIDRIGDVSF
jgi:ATP-dependent Clp protease protease subunit